MTLPIALLRRLHRLLYSRVPPPVSVQIDGPASISAKGTYDFTALHSGFTSPSFLWEEKPCSNSSDPNCVWTVVATTGATYSRTLAPDCTAGYDKFFLRVTVTDSDGVSAGDDHTVYLCNSGIMSAGG